MKIRDLFKLKNQGFEARFSMGSLGNSKLSSLTHMGVFRNFQFARVFQEKNAKTPSKFSRPYKKILKPLPQKYFWICPC